jgi:ABC-type multidrug transport system ATPase subunit
VTIAARTVPPAQNALEARQLAREYDDLLALKSLDLDVRSGELIALVGPNGAGKTTLLAIAAGLLEPSEGSVRIAGWLAGSLQARAAASYLPDTPVFYDDLSLNEHLEYISRLHLTSDWARRAERLLERLGLEDWGESLPRQFSHGMRQKASIALAFVRPFSLLLADEPFDGLDPPSRAALVELLREACAGGAAVLVSTHRVEAADFATRCLALYDGELTYNGPPDPAVIAGFAPASEELPRAATAPVPAVEMSTNLGEAVSLSTASFEDFRALGMTVQQAVDLLHYRERRGRFDSVDELAEVPGFSAELIADLEEKVRP